MLYPFKFTPILKETIWGGDEICRFKNLHPQRQGIGESWEISHIKDSVSIVANGKLNGKSLEELIETYGERLLGKTTLETSGATFPLLIKFIDARDALSVQVHPNDELAQKRHHSFGKTEMWYVIKAAPGAYLYSGFSQVITPEQYLKSLEDNTFLNYLQKHEVKSGDVFFLPAGRVHALGAGCFIAEIQQTSNITYRIYDYHRNDVQGNPRELHMELAKNAIDYRVYPDCKLSYTPKFGGIQTLVSCPYFTTYLIESEQDAAIRFNDSNGSFSIYICMEGKARLTDNNESQTEIRQGETALFPAENPATEIRLAGKSKILQVR
ncbi:MAG: class I mannose-6-phosphate isomerase [Dysgonamonadaceae bacterium]|jgi:mannose-6-phosphate isomerase|nr:class I mannose-6-phosphate isomerase [Dysgonamonadaceae bacterium]